MTPNQAPILFFAFSCPVVHTEKKKKNTQKFFQQMTSPQNVPVPAGSSLLLESAPSDAKDNVFYGVSIILFLRKD